MRAAARFAHWSETGAHIHELSDIEPVHLAAYIETLIKALAASSVKQHLAAIRMLFDWLVVGQVIATNPASPVRGPKNVVRKGRRPVLTVNVMTQADAYRMIRRRAAQAGIATRIGNHSFRATGITE